MATGAHPNKNAMSYRLAANIARAKKRPRGLYDRPRGLICGWVEFYCVMVTFTVIAVLVTPPEDGVIVRVDDLDPPPPPRQPATSTNTIIAPAIPRRVRNRRASGSMNSRPIASMMKSTCRSNADGGTFMDCGGTMKDDAVMAPLAVAPGAGAALVVGTEHEVISIPGVQVKATAPVNPPNPVTTTGNDAGRAFGHRDGRSGRPRNPMPFQSAGRC